MSTPHHATAPAQAVDLADLAARAGSVAEPVRVRLADSGDGLGPETYEVAPDGSVRRIDGDDTHQVGLLVGLRTHLDLDGIDVGVTEFFAEPQRAQRLHLVLSSGGGARGRTQVMPAPVAGVG